MERCPKCRSVLTEKAVEQVFKNGRVVIKNVPLEHCAACGKDFIEAGLQFKIGEIVQNARNRKPVFYSCVLKRTDVGTYIIIEKDTGEVAA